MVWEGRQTASHGQASRLHPKSNGKPVKGFKPRRVMIRFLKDH